MAGAKPATVGVVRVLHRAVDSDDDDGASSSPQQSLQELQAANESLQQRLEHAKTSAAAEKRKLTDELRLERAGRERAEELLVRQAKELEACAAAKARLEEAFSRSMSELRYTRAEHTQSKQTIQQLLRELVLLRDAISRSQGANLGGGRAGSGSAPANGSTSHRSQGMDGGTGSPTAVASAAMSKATSKGKLLGELQQLRAQMAEAELRAKEAEAEKERAEECQEMISKQTAKLLDDRAALISDLSSKDDVVRDLQAGLDHLQHQLHIALNDRNLLLQQLHTLAGEAAAPELAALTAAMQSGFSQDLEQLEAFAHGADAFGMEGLDEGLSGFVLGEEEGVKHLLEEDGAAAAAGLGQATAAAPVAAAVAVAGH